MRRWDKEKHPRNKAGKFTKKGSAENTAAVHSAIDDELKSGEKSPASAKRLVDHLSQLSVKELHELKKKYGVSASGVKAELIEKIAKRLDSGRRADQSKNPESISNSVDNKIDEREKKVDTPDVGRPVVGAAKNAEGGGKKDQGETMEPHEMTLEEFTNSGLPTGGFIKPIAHSNYIVKALKEGKSVNEELILKYVEPQEVSFSMKMANQYGEGWKAKLQELKENLAETSDTVSLSSDGKSLTARMKQTRNGFVESKKGQFIQVSDEWMVITSAGRGGHIKIDGEIYGYFQKLKVRKAKPSELEFAKKCNMANDAIVHAQTISNNRDYPEVKTRQLKEYEEKIAAVFGREA